MTSLSGFADLSQFLRAAMADEDTQRLSESMQHLALHAEAVVAGLRLDRRREHAAPLLMDMLTVLRDHRSMVVDLGMVWHGLYEYGAYLGALNGFRAQIGHWLLDVRPWDDELQVSADDFALLAWRTVGEGMLLIDMYEQWLQREEGDERAARAARARSRREAEDSTEPPLQWWQKLRR